MELVLQVLIVAVLAGPASSLSCYTCSGFTSWSSCPATQANTCSPTSTACGAAALLLQANSSSATIYIRSCLPPSLCNTQMSLSTGQLNATFNSSCCTTNSCNTNTPAEFTPMTLGTLQCYGGVNQQSAMTCSSSEDRCFTVTAQNLVTVSGCASLSACNNMAYIGAYFGVPSNASASCCTGPLCNQASPASSSLVCYTCSSSSPGSCANLSVCSPSFTTCGSFAVQILQNGTSTTQYLQTCATPQTCNVPLSISIGVFSATTFSQCCTSSLCNLVNSVQAFTPTSGTLQCYGGVNQQSNVTCRNTEDHCFTVTVSNVATISGCASQSVCANMATTGAYFGLPSNVTASCCTGSFCNRANPVSNSSVCYTCSSSSPGSCARLSVCHPSFTTCGSFAVQLVENGVSSTQYYQSCAYPGICNSPLSFNYGVFSASVNAQCCTTSLCNLVNSVTVSPEAPNSLTCYVGINGAIQGSVQCKGSETLCFTVGLASAGTVRGCTSQGVCDNYVTVLGFFGDTPTTKPICCSGNLCNSSWRPRWSPVLFLLVLTVMTFFY